MPLGGLANTRQLPDPRGAGQSSRPASAASPGGCPCPQAAPAPLRSTGFAGRSGHRAASPDSRHPPVGRLVRGASSGAAHHPVAAHPAGRRAWRCGPARAPGVITPRCCGPWWSASCCARSWPAWCSRGAAGRSPSRSGMLLGADGLVHAGGGLTDLHFHFFVVLALIGLYQDWVPFALAVSLVAVHHLGVGLVAPDTVFAGSRAQDNPLPWALLHAAFVLAMSAAQIVLLAFRRRRGGRERPAAGRDARAAQEALRRRPPSEAEPPGGRRRAGGRQRGRPQRGTGAATGAGARPASPRPATASARRPARRCWRSRPRSARPATRSTAAPQQISAAHVHREPGRRRDRPPRLGHRRHLDDRRA